MGYHPLGLRRVAENFGETLMRKPRPSLRVFLLLLAVAIVAGTTALTGEKGPPLEFRQVADWPTLPAGMKLGGVSALATDSKDNVYILHRIKPYVIIFAKDGKFLRSWDADFKTP